MPSLVRNVARLQWPFDIRPTGTQIYRRFKVHDLIKCESKVQVIVSLARHEVLFALGRHEDLLYLPTQIRFLIGGERVTCHGSNLQSKQSTHFAQAIRHLLVNVYRWSSV